MSPASGLLVGADGVPRCAWAGTAPDYVDYHDHEWGRPVRGEAALFERISLEVFQSGLSWLTILRKRPAFRAAFHGFDPDRVAALTDDDVERLVLDPGIVRNRRKIEATVGNARAVLALRRRGGLEEVFAAAAPSRPVRPARLEDVPAATPASTALAERLRAAGLRHVGPTTMYAAMQACGLVTDHLVGCAAGDALEAGR